MPSPGSGRLWLLVLAAGLVLSRWGLRSRWLADWRPKLLGATIAQRLDRWSRHLRVMAWQYRRSARSAQTEAEHG